MISFSGDWASSCRSATWIGCPGPSPAPDSDLRDDAALPQGRDQFLIHAVSGAQIEFALPLVEHVDGSGVRAGKLCRLGDDGCQHGLEIERGIDRLRDFAERLEFADRAPQLIGALAQLAKQARILDRDDRLGGQIREQSDLLLAERSRLAPVIDQRPDMLVVLQHRNGQHGAQRQADRRSWPGRFDHVARPFGGIDDLRHLLVHVGQALRASAKAGGVLWVATSANALPSH